MRAERAGLAWRRVSWCGLHVALAAIVAVAVHRFLLRPPAAAPWAFARWTGLLYLTVLLCRALAGRRGFRDAPLARRWRSLGWDWMLLIAFFALLLAIQNVAFDHVRNDGRYYFLQVRSVVMDLDLGMDTVAAPLGARRHVAEYYASGAPLLWIPFYVAAHLWLRLWGLLGHEVVLDGYWYPYQRAVALGTLVYGIAALALMYDLARRHFSRAIGLLATVAIATASFVGWYVVAESSMSHGVSMFTATLFLYLWERTRDGRTLRQWAALGAAAGLMTMARWQNLLFVLVPVLEVLAIHATAVRRGRSPAIAGKELGRYLVAAGAALVAFFPQLLVWRIARGRWLEHPARAHGVEWTRGAVADVLFSSNHGLLSWTPVIWLSLLGIAVMAVRRWRLAWPLAVAFLAQLYINSTVAYWWGGAAFGARRFSNCALVFVLGLAALLELCRRRPLVAPTAILAAMVLVNSVFMYDVGHGALPQEGRVPADRLLERVYLRTGNPFALPESVLTALRMGVGIPFYDSVGGRSYNNLILEMGPEDSREWLVSGWAAPEVTPRRDFSWALGEEATIVVPLKAASDYTVRLRCAPFHYPDAPPQVVQLLVNGEPVGRIGLRPGLSDYEVRVPAAHIRPGLNRFAFRFAWARSPRELGLQDDSRPLAVQFDRIALIRTGEGPTVEGR